MRVSAPYLVIGRTRLVLGLLEVNHVGLLPPPWPVAPDDTDDHVEQGLSDVL
ncbi:MAG: hypothetical protein GY720_22145 [bacterium]|nr:hypothetical protein [bacterium]